ncbi:hypothetical protein Q4602_04885 [Paraglaciecola chathamensis]|uniref:hypothetical protein n=1 Tax=Paraglaciecola chathamensis TaxID=368405 RepID=UPI002706BE71|nr:hypothetical protein [Paraglaciecola chathamensis]MDO6838790.1 hypothetical protein [Paraglaciecola chathamensis]
MQNCKTDKNICIFPKFQGDNEYLLNLYLILKSQFTDVKFVALSPKTMLKNLLKGRRADVLILNWLEDYPCLKKGFLGEAQETLRVILGMLIASLYYRKIIWVRHNYKPHLTHSKFCYSVLCGAIRLFSAQTVTHRSVREFSSQVIPHPLYKKTDANTVAPFDYFIFGNVKPYKNIPMILRNWAPGKELKIIGKCKEEALSNEINRLIKSGLPKVSYENRFLDVEELNGLLSSVTFVILGHEEDSMIVSGTFYHAISFGANVILKDSEYGRSVKEEFPLVHLVANFRDEALSALTPFPREDIIALANRTYADSVILQQWHNLLEH